MLATNLFGRMAASYKRVLSVLQERAMLATNLFGRMAASCKKALSEAEAIFRYGYLERFVAPVTLDGNFDFIPRSKLT